MIRISTVYRADIICVSHVSHMRASYGVGIVVGAHGGGEKELLKAGRWSSWRGDGVHGGGQQELLKAGRWSSWRGDGVHGGRGMDLLMRSRSEMEQKGEKA